MVQQISINISLKQFFAFLIIGVAFIAIAFLSIQSNAQTIGDQDYASHLEQLIDTDTPFYIGFVHPINERFVGWDIPDNIISEGEKIGSRYITELGSDYICIGESGVSDVMQFCVPFSNIAYVTHSTIPTR